MSIPAVGGVASLLLSAAGVGPVLLLLPVGPAAAAELPVAVDGPVAALVGVSGYALEVGPEAPPVSKARHKHLLNFLSHLNGAMSAFFFSCMTSAQTG